MKFLKKILYGIAALFILLCGFIMLCAMNPGMSEQITDALKLGKEGQLIPESVVGNSVYLNNDILDNNVTDNEHSQDNASDNSFDISPESTEKSVYGPLPDNTIWSGNTNKDIGQEEDPALSGITAPEEVAGKNGYEPIKEKSSEIDDVEAEQLLSELNTGRTGDDLTFDVRFYPYYYMLDDKGQHLYRQIYANATALNKKFAPIESVSLSELKNCFAAVYNDHPELFWMDTAYSCKYKKDGKCAEIELQFNYTADDLEKEKATFNDKVNAIVSQAQELDSDYDREKYVHDALIEQVEYSASAKINQSAYSALVNGSTVCAGYARAFQYMMQQLWIPCYYCTGYAGESHAWDIVALDDGYYNVDATWDDTGNGTYAYFNKTDADYAGNHLRQDLSVNLPPCNGMAFRNLEPDADENGEKRSLADVGMTKENALTTLESYYNDCYQALYMGGKGEYDFQIALSGDALFNDVYEAYQTEDYRQGYMDKALTALGAVEYRIDWSIEALQEDCYLVTHKVVIK
ncbi:MAG: hypothetical protein K2H31_10390 [Lachnospiraceae bacterium]|nr:hypothetical protein [Lachnospiraceae bacterium]